jgi:hypothetical protein
MDRGGGERRGKKVIKSPKAIGVWKPEEMKTRRPHSWESQRQVGLYVWVTTSWRVSSWTAVQMCRQSSEVHRSCTAKRSLHRGGGWES